MISETPKGARNGAVPAGSPAASSTIRVEVRLFGTLARRHAWKGAFKPREIGLEKGSAVSDLLSHLRIPIAEVGIVTINGRPVKNWEVLEDGDLVCVYQPVFGG